MADKGVWKSILAASPGGVLIVDDQRQVVFANAAAARMLDQSEEQLIGSHLPPMCLADGTTPLERPGPSGRTLEINGKPIEWKGKPATLLSISDITRLKHSQTRNSRYARLDHAVTELADFALTTDSTLALQKKAAALARSVLDTQFSAVFACHPDSKQLELIAGDGWPNGSLGKREPFAIDDTRAAGHVSRTGHAIAIRNWATEKRFETMRLLHTHGVVSSLYVPVPHVAARAEQEHSWDVFGVYTTQARTFSAHEIHFLRSIAYILSYASQHAQLIAHERENVQLLRATGRIASIGGWMIDLAGDCVTWSEETAAIYGLPPKIITLSLDDAGKRTDPAYYTQVQDAVNQLMRTGESFDCEIKIIKTNGERAWVHTIGEPVYDPSHQITGIRGAVQDVTADRKAREQIDFLARHDTLTQLPNIWHLRQHLHDAIVNCRVNQKRATLMLLDLDDFKTFNDTLGHAEGDRLLQQVADRLRDDAPEGAFIARPGGDEFMIVVPGLDTDIAKASVQAEAMGQAILHRLRLPFQLGHTEYYGTQSLGIITFGSPGDDATELLKQADMAMYAAKTRGRDQVCVFDPAMQKDVKARAAMETDMRSGLAHGEFQAFFQGQVDADGRTTGAEVLARWCHPRRGLVSPGEFIPLAESTGLIQELGHVMLTKACEQLVHWAKSPVTSGWRLAVNVSARQFHHPEFVADVRNILKGTGANPRRLVLELTETSVIENVEDAVAKMKTLRFDGISFSLDDFGTGYSSLYYLRKLPLAELKIDQSFVRGVNRDSGNATIVRTIMALARAMGIKVIAEGVETPAERLFLESAGCEAFQGFLFHHPEPIEAFQLQAIPRRKLAQA